MAKQLTNDAIILRHRIAMRQRAFVAAKFLSRRKRKLTVPEIAQVIYTTWIGSDDPHRVRSNQGDLL
jgi:hypothetical protein